MLLKINIFFKKKHDNCMACLDEEVVYVARNRQKQYAKFSYANCPNWDMSNVVDLTKTLTAFGNVETSTNNRQSFLKCR